MQDDFDYVEFIDSLYKQALDFKKNELYKAVDMNLVASYIKRYSNIIAEKVSKNPDLTCDAKMYRIQLVAEWVFHKSVDLYNAKIPAIYWDNVLDEIVATIFEHCEKISEILTCESLELIEKCVNESYVAGLDKLKKDKLIDNYIYDCAKNQSSIDTFSHINNKKEQDLSNETENVSIDELLKDALWVLVPIIFYLLKLYKRGVSNNFIICSIYIIGIVVALILLYFLYLKLTLVYAKYRLRHTIKDFSKRSFLFPNIEEDLICIEIGNSLLGIVDPDISIDFIVQIMSMRKSISQDYGFVTPFVRIIDNQNIGDNEVLIKIRGNQVARFNVYPDWKLILNKKIFDNLSEEVKRNSLIENDIITQRPYYWVSENGLEYEIDALDPVEAIIRILKYIVLKNVDKLFLSSLLPKYFKQIKKSKNIDFDYNKITKELKKELGFEDISKVLVNLLEENVPIIDLSLILERLHDYARFTKDKEELSEKIRLDFAHQICLKNVDKNQVLYTINLSQEVEQLVRNNDDYSIIEELSTKIKQKIDEVYNKTDAEAVIICSKDIRRKLFKMLSLRIQNITVIADSELVPNIEIRNVETLD